MYVCAPHVCLVPAKTLDPLELGLAMAVSHHVDARVELRSCTRAATVLHRGLIFLTLFKLFNSVDYRVPAHAHKCVRMCACASEHMPLPLCRGQRTTHRVSSSFLPRRFGAFGLNSDSQAWWQAPLLLNHLTGPNSSHSRWYHQQETLHKC